MRKRPKIELHRHLDCSVRWQTVRDLSKELQLDLPHDDEEKFKEQVLIREPMKDLKTVLSKFLIAQKVLATEKILERVAFEATEDAAKDGIKLIEFRYSPSFISSGHENLSFEKIHIAIQKGIERAKKEYEIGVGLIGIIGRNDPLDLANSVMDFFIDHKDSFVGVDLADNEVDFDCKPFAPLFERAKNSGLKITIHAGEPLYEGAFQSVKDAVEVLGAERIGHGIQVHQNPEWIDYVIQKGVFLEVCPTSNYITQSVETLKQHPIKKLFDEGVKLNINTDDPGIFDYDLTHEYEVSQKLFDFSEDDFNKMNSYALDSSFLPDDEKKIWSS